VALGMALYHSLPSSTTVPKLSTFWEVERDSSVLWACMSTFCILPLVSFFFAAYASGWLRLPRCQPACYRCCVRAAHALASRSRSGVLPYLRLALPLLFSGGSPGMRRRLRLAVAQQRGTGGGERLPRRYRGVI